jgi:hypothetical protein
MKKVRFAPKNDERNEVHVYFEPMFTDVALWLAEDDFAESKKAQKHAIVKVRQKGGDRLVENSFADPGSDVQKSLNEFTRHTDGRGLERHASPNHFKERTAARSMAIKAILLGQEQAAKQGLKLEDVSEQIRELSLQYCLSAKIFARRMGKADEYAVYKKTLSSNMSVDTHYADTKRKSSRKSCLKRESSIPAKISVKPLPRTCSSQQLQASPCSSRNACVV